MVVGESADAVWTVDPAASFSLAFIEAASGTTDLVKRFVPDAQTFVGHQMSAALTDGTGPAVSGHDDGVEVSFAGRGPMPRSPGH